MPAPSAAMSERTPVEVSAWTAAMIAGDGWADSTRSTSTGCPHSCSTATTSAPHRAATSVIRWPKSPLTATTTTSPGWTVLTNAASMPADPVALSGRVRAFVVPQAVRSIAHVSSMIRRNSGSRCPSSGIGQGAGGLGIGVGRTGTEEVALADHVVEPNQCRRLTAPRPG